MEVMIGILLCGFALSTCLVGGELALAALVPDDSCPLGVAFLAGLGALSLYSNALLIAGVFVPLALWIPVPIIWFLWLRHRRGVAMRVRTSLASRVRACIAQAWLAGPLLWCAIGTGILFIALTCTPIAGTDSLVYHLPFAVDFIQVHTLRDPIAGITHLGLGYNPALGEIMVASVASIGLSNSLVIPVILLNAAVLFAFMQALYLISGAFIRHPPVRALVLLTLFIAPVIRDAIIVQVGYVDFCYAAFATLGALLLFRGLRERHMSLMYTGAFLLGVALAIKYLTLIVAAYCAMIALSFFLRKRNVELPFRSLAVALSIMAAVPAYWYLKNAILHADPVYPLLSGSGPESAIESVNYLPHTWWVRLFYPLLVYATFFFRPVYARLAIEEFLVAVGAFAGSVILLMRRSAGFWVCVFFGYCVWYSWAVSIISDDPRYNIPSLIMWAVLGGILLDRLLETFSAPAKLWMTRVAAVVFLTLLPMMVGIYNDKILFVTGRISAATYLARQYPGLSIDQYRAATTARPL